MASAVRGLHQIHRAQTLKWQKQELIIIQSMIHDDMRKMRGAVSLIFDAARFGKPGREYLVASASAGALHFVPPPQVHLPCSILQRAQAASSSEAWQ